MIIKSCLNSENEWQRSKDFLLMIITLQILLHLTAQKIDHTPACNARRICLMTSSAASMYNRLSWYDSNSENVEMKAEFAEYLETLSLQTSCALAPLHWTCLRTFKYSISFDYYLIYFTRRYFIKFNCSKTTSYNLI